MRQPRDTQSARGEQLVVRERQRARRVQQVDPCVGEPFELADAALDSVQPLAHVEPPQRDVARLEEAQRVARGQHGRVESQRRGGGDQGLVRVRAALGDDGEPHAVIVGLRTPAMGFAPVNAG